MPERATVRLNIQRGAGVGEFREFLTDLEDAYVALLTLPVGRRSRRGRLRWIDYLDLGLVAPDYLGGADAARDAMYPEDRLEIDRISIQSPGWVDLGGIGKVLEQIREWLKDRHEHKKHVAWRDDTEREHAQLANEVLRSQAERERIGVIRDQADLLKELGFSDEERQRILWERIGGPLARLGHYQDTGLLGSQNDDIDGKQE